jgi:hypothetical protein
LVRSQCAKDDLAYGTLGEHAPADRPDERQQTALLLLRWGMGAHCKFAEPKNRSHGWRRHEIHLAGSHEGDVRRSSDSHTVLLGNIVRRDEAIEQHVMRGGIALAARAGRITLPIPITGSRDRRAVRG